MTTDIQLLRSSVARKRPDPSQLLDGQAAINTNPEEPGLYFKLSSGNLTKIGPAVYNTNSAAPNSSPAGSTGNAVGETWLDGRSNYASAILRVWNGAAWLNSSGFTVDETSGDYSIARQLTATALIGNGTGDDSFIRFPNDTTNNRPATPQAGMGRFNTTDNVFELYDGTDWVRYLATGGSGGGGGNVTVEDLTVDGDSTIGSNCGSSTLAINSVTSVNCDATIGATTGNTLTVTSRISSDLIPNNSSRDLGSSGLRWAEAWVTTLNASGNSVLGSGCTSTLTIDAATTIQCNTILGTDSGNRVNFNALIGSNIVPDGNATRDLGSATARWANLYVSDLDIAGDFTIGNNCTSNFTINSITEVNCSMTIGAGTAGQTLNVRSAVSSDLISDGQSRDLGSAGTPWNDTFTTNLIVATNATLGSACGTSTITVNGVLSPNCSTNFQAEATLWNRNELRFSNAATPGAGANYIGFEAPAGLTGNQIWTLPPADGNPNQVLRTDGNGVLSWVNVQSPTNDISITGNLTVGGDTVLGDTCGTDTLQVNATATFNCDSTFQANTTFGQGSSQLASFLAPTNHSADLRMLSQNELTFHTGDDTSNSVGFKAPAAVGTSAMWTLPPGDGGNGTVLTTNGSGTLSWQAVSSTGQVVTVSNNAPTASLTQGQLWWKSDDANNAGSNRLYVYYIEPGDATGQWVDASPPAGGATGQFVLLSDLKTAAANSATYTDFQAAIAAL